MADIIYGIIFKVWKNVMKKRDQKIYTEFSENKQ